MDLRYPAGHLKIRPLKSRNIWKRLGRNWKNWKILLEMTIKGQVLATQNSCTSCATRKEKEMGMYTELILGCSLKRDTPVVAINALLWMCGKKDKPEDLPNHSFFNDKENRKFIFQLEVSTLGLIKAFQRCGLTKLIMNGEYRHAGILKIIIKR